MTKMMSAIRIGVLAIAAVLCGMGISCKKDNPVQPTPPGHTPLTLRADAPTCTRLRLKWNDDSGAVSHRYLLLRDGRDTVYRDSLPGRSSLISVVDSKLSPNRRYEYSLFRIVAGQRWDSAGISIVTMDTTSSVFQWTISVSSQIGDIIHGVSIVSDTSVWLVGQFRDDTSDPGHVRIYPVIRWNGGRMVDHWDHSSTITSELYSIFTFSDTDVWAGSGYPSHWDGHAWTLIEDTLFYQVGAINAIWGTSGSNLFFGTGMGKLIHYDGVSFTSIPTGITYAITDIWGDTTGGGEEVLLVGNNYPNGLVHTLASVSARSITNIPDSGIESLLSGSWFIRGGPYVLAGDGSFWKDSLPEQVWHAVPTKYLMYAARGNAPNDICMCGGFGEVMHWNGVRWTSQYSQTKIDGNYERIAMRGRYVYCIGYAGDSRTRVAIGVRQ
jgi:hypothetical protein